MKHEALVGVMLATAVAMPAAAQMMLQNGMGGGRRNTVNLISPADLPIQIRRGELMVGGMMMMGTSMGPNAASPATKHSPALKLILRLYGVSNAAGVVSSSDNHLIVEGRLLSADGLNEPLSVDQGFSLIAGNGLVLVPVPLPTLVARATLSIDKIMVNDANGNTFAVPGVVLVPPTPPPTAVLGGGCTQASDCDDGDPTTADVCTSMGCRHMGSSMGPMH